MTKNNLQHFRERMKKQLQVWRLVAKSLEQNIPVMLLYVLESFGSSPGRAGFAMAVNASGETEGSIGGGIMEHKFVEMAKDKLKEQQEECIVYKQIHDKVSATHQSGMICSGEQTIVAYTVAAKDLASVKAIINCIESNKTGTLQLSKDGINFSSISPAEDMRYEYHDEDREDWVYEEKIGCKNYLHIVGAGHCALALSQMMSGLGFYVHLYDDRGELKTFDNNSFADEKIILDGYEELKDLITDDRDYVIVMTVGYRTDDIAVRTLMKRSFRYFGVLGSKKKIEKMFNSYKMEGISAELLAMIDAPAGIPISSQTPEEIAVSIAAKIISVKNQVKY